ncbi:hypothetical protein [Methanoculleus chikugoensis]|uniref:hypothetical protein n=1 Tax=Methanoculleus chikugoensis TaxID=118126 RepID=UPI001FB48E3D|nr:hypothetical protein [Methanoculleus chikugoensis]
MSRNNPLRYAIALLIALLGVLIAYAALTTPGLSPLLWAAAAVVLAGVVAAASMQIADQWEKALVLRLGRFSGLRGGRESLPSCRSSIRWPTGSIFGRSRRRFGRRRPSPGTPCRSMSRPSSSGA